MVDPALETSTGSETVLAQPLQDDGFLPAATGGGSRGGQMCEFLPETGSE